MDHETSEAARKRAALFALGALEGDDLVAFKAHLLGGCGFCRDEVEAFRAVLRETPDVHAGTSLAPVKERLLRQASAATEPEPAILEQSGLRFVRGHLAPWQPLPVSGVEVKFLSADEERGYTTQLVYMAPGARYPDHCHGGTEDLYVLQGNLEVSGVTMRAGDYCRANAGSVHTGIRSNDGCVFLSTTSVNDRLIT